MPQGFDPYADSVGPGIYGGVVRRDAAGEVVPTDCSNRAGVGHTIMEEAPEARAAGLIEEVEVPKVLVGGLGERGVPAAPGDRRRPGGGDRWRVAEAAAGEGVAADGDEAGGADQRPPGEFEPLAPSMVI